MLGIQQIFEEHKERYISLRITKVLKKKGIKINQTRVRKLMCQMKLYAKDSRYRYKHYNKKLITLHKKTQPLKSSFSSVSTK
ncbi:IS3 family transposase [Bacillus cereus]|uniref:IS3 family transposase n=1 Tax=Bacillus cereus TaxID=1396 RepID=UPI0009B1D042